MPTTYAIKNGRTVFTPTLYTSNGSTQTVNNSASGTSGFKPDLVWTKDRTSATNHWLADSVRGVANNLNSNLTNTQTSLPNFYTSFNSNGFSLGTGNYTNGDNIVGWQWQAGQGTTSTNTAGTITSTVSVNQTAGFSVVKYQSRNVGSTLDTIGHGLGVAPAMVIIKSLDNTWQWVVGHSSLPSWNYYLTLNSGVAQTNDSTIFNGTAPTSTLFTIGGGGAVNAGSENHIAYCWAPVAGFSQFGSYTGNGSANGPFIYTGFRPAYLLIKNASITQDWLIEDTSRGPYNTVVNPLFADANFAEGNNPASYSINFLSNGFKIAVNDTVVNGNGNTMIYAAFAECPFKYANAR